jgi:hypothetical protein
MRYRISEKLSTKGPLPVSINLPRPEVSRCGKIAASIGKERINGKLSLFFHGINYF